MKQAAFITTNAYDMILLPDGSFYTVDSEGMKDFLNAASTGDDFTSWHGTDSWEDHAETMDEAIEVFTEHETSDLLAFYENGKLTVLDAESFERRREYHLGE